MMSTPFNFRLPWGSKQTGTIAAGSVRYRITLRLPTATELDEYFFAHAVATDDGKIERLQILGFFNRPLDYDYTQRPAGVPANKSSRAHCLAVSAAYYRKFHGLPAHHDITTTLNQHVLERWLDQGGGVLGRMPDKDGFARLRIPGGHIMR